MGRKKLLTTQKTEEKMKKIIKPGRGKKKTTFFSRVGQIWDFSKQSQQKRQELKSVSEVLQKTSRKLTHTASKNDMLERRNAGLITLEKQLQDIPTQKAENALVKVLADEIYRLQTIVTSEREQVTKTLLTHPFGDLPVPKFVKSKNPITLLSHYKKYRKEKKEFEAVVQAVKNAEINMTLSKEETGVNIENNGTQRYKTDYLKVHGTYLEVGDRLIRTYYLADIPAYLSPYVFFKLITSSLPFTMSIFLEPTSSGELVKKARQRLSVLEMQQNDRMKKGKSRDQQVEKSIEEVNSFIEELVHEAEKGIVYSLYMSIEAKDTKELKNLHKELQNLTDGMEFTLNTYTFGQQQALQNFLPFNNDMIKENRILQSTAASYLMPFVSKQLHDPEGIFLGINAYHDSLVFVNPFTVRNSNVNIFGVSGSGKSVTAKLLATRMYTRGTQVLIIDPEAEYVDFVRNLGGEVIQFSRDNGINPFYINSTDENDILDHISILKTFFKFFIPQDRYDGAVLDQALISLYDTGNPNLENLLKKIKKDPMYNYLKVLDEGSLRGVFNAKRRLELNNELIVFDISPLINSEKKAPAMYLLTSLIWNLVNKKSDRKRMLFIDEAHKLLVDRDVAIFYREMVKQARKRNLGVVSITQDVEDFLHGEFGKAILTNSETKILLKQSYATLSLLGNIYPMTDEEKQQLGSLGTGEVVLFRENEHMRVDMFLLPYEQQLLFPNK